MYYIGTVIVLCVGSVIANDDLKLLDSIQQEDPCSMQGGICTIAKDCPKNQLAEDKGLCPQQRSMGVECCYGLSVKETRCQKRGGTCFQKPNYCSDTLTYKEATDCPENTSCCILVE